MSFQTRNLDYEPIGEARSQIIENPAQDESVLILNGFKTDSRRLLFYHIFCIIFAGIPYVIFTWFPRFRTLQFKKCSLHTANVISITDSHNYTAILHVHYEHNDIPILGFRDIRYFEYQHSKYIWDVVKGIFVVLEELIPKLTFDSILEDSQGLVEPERLQYIKIYGPNKIVVKVKSYWQLFTEEVFNPFYVFQSFSVILWCLDEYVIYAGCVFILTTFSIATNLIQTRKQSVALHNLIQSSNSGNIDIIRRHMIQDNAIASVDPSQLVPGDLIIIPKSGCVMSCDAILLNGHCIVNESMLTGESVPITKTPPTPTPDTYHHTLHKRHTLYSGTHVIQTRYYGGAHVQARVVRTGFATTKGALVKSIMFPAPLGLKFYRDSLKFVVFMFAVAAGGMGYCMYLYIMRGAEVREVIIRALDIITIVVPPALPAAMTVGIVYSMNRLKKMGVFCISPPRINVCGKLKLACFDKTGTLTNEGLDMSCVLPVLNSSFSQPIDIITQLDIKDPLLQAMATCHSLTRIDGKLNGDPLDLNMFESTKWDLDEPGTKETTRYDMLAPTVVKPCEKYYKVDSPSLESGEIDIPYEVGIIRQFPFSSNQQCMSVICRELGLPSMTVFTKGAPEKLLSMCKPTTIPVNFTARLNEFTARGFRVISVAYKSMPRKFKWKEAQKITREHIECDLSFLGFIIMQNTLKPETTPVIASLRHAQIRTLMITGDNIFTAISVARDCNMVQTSDEICLIRTIPTGNNTFKIVLENYDTPGETSPVNINFNESNYHFAMDGETWSKLRMFYPDLLPSLLLRTTIFGRFQPEQKTQLITQLQSIDYIVSMVGDGANDCGALKAAHIGISLSQAEASVAAPFTSKIDNISCLLFLIMEGRCALVTSFAVFKYMAMYSLIQFFTILILYKHHSILGDQQFLFIDLIITTSLAVTIGRQGPSPHIVPSRPPASLVTPTNTIPLLLQVLTCALVQTTAIYYLSLQPWYTENRTTSPDEVIVCWQNTVLFTVSCFQYVVMAVVYSKGRPYRQILLRNFWLLFCALSLTCFTTFLCVAPTKYAAEFFELIYLPHGHEYVQHIFRYKLMLFPVGHFIIAMFIEYFVAEKYWLKRVVHFITRKKGPKNKFKSLRQMDLHRILQPLNNQHVVQTETHISC